MNNTVNNTVNPKVNVMNKKIIHSNEALPSGNTEFTKLKIALKYFCIGKGFTKALRILNFCSEYHVGLRKDGITPEISHQIEIALFLRTLPNVDGILEDLISVALVHDLLEDYQNIIDIDEFKSVCGCDTVQQSKLMSKIDQGNKMDNDEYYKSLAKDPIRTLVKCADRLHNIQSMYGVFSENKQAEYMRETNEYVLPLLKNGKNTWPEYEAAFENIKLAIMTQYKVLNASSISMNMNANKTPSILGSTVSNTDDLGTGI